MVNPVFILGMDGLSLTWLERAAGTLARIGATGLVVEARDREDWLRLQAAAAGAGVNLELTEGDRVAGLFPGTTYPALFIGEALARQWEGQGVKLGAQP